MRFTIKGGLHFLFLALSKGIDIGVRGGGAVGAVAPPRLENFPGKLCFQGKRKLLKNPE